MPVNPQHRKWCFTINNPSDQDDPMDKLVSLGDSVKYAVFQKESGENGTVHWQGYIEWRSRGRRLTGMKLLFPRAHFEPAKGSASQNREYCSKEQGRIDGPFEIGECPQGPPGRRNDLEAVKRRIDEGASDMDIANEFFGQWCRYERAFKRYRMMTQVGRNWQTKVMVLFGEPGTGKTKLAMKMALEEASALGRNQFKGLLNHCDLNVQVKGAAVSFRGRSIYITSNKKPSDWWKIETQDQRDAWPQIQRRLSPPIGRVYRATRNEEIEASDEEFKEGFCRLEEDPESINLPEPIIPSNVFRINADADV
jgi:hypothetical protein